MGKFLKEQVSSQRMQVDQMERDMKTAQKWGAMHGSVNKKLGRSR